MKQRVLVAAVGVPALLAVLLLAPSWATMLLTLAIAAIAAYEMLHTAGRSKLPFLLVLTVAASALSVLGVFLQLSAALWIMRFAFVALLFAAAVVQYEKEKPIPFSDLAVAVFAGLVIPMLYSGIFLVRMTEPFGRVYVLAPFVIAFIGDSFSMFGGMIFGGKKMAPHVSPKKTWAGGIAGPVGSAAGMALLGLVGHLVWGYAPNYALMVLLGAVGNVVGQLGDLSMSLIKREVGIKDYSRLFLEHGGMLDRFDSTMLIAPVVYFFVAGGLI